MRFHTASRSSQKPAFEPVGSIKRAVGDLRRLAFAIVALTVVAGCKGDSGIGPRVPSLVEAAASSPSAIAGIAMTTAPTFDVKDAGGSILGGVAVTIAVTAGGGTLTGAPTSTVGGAPTSIGTWTLGRTAGINTVTVTVGSLTPLVITVTGVAGPAAALAMVAGDAQSALAGTILPIPLSVQVRDQFSNGVSGSVVTFIVTAGGGVITPSTVTTDANGNATGAVWRLGKIAVPQTATASSATFSTAATATIASEYLPDVRVFGPPMPAEGAAAFAFAVARIRASVVGDLTDIDFAAISANAGFDLTQCGVPGVLLNEVIDDVVIYATVSVIDGPGKILASAGPCLIRNTSQTAVVGVMRFDSEDIGGIASTGRLNDIVLHEMLHVVGVGTNWRGKFLITGVGTGDPRFTGALGIAACSGAGGTTVCLNGVPVENTGGAGTADAHWRESTFDTELMTGFVEAPGVATPLSNMTLQSLADAGYVVNAPAADLYTIPGTSAIRLRTSASPDDVPAWDQVITPLFEVGRSGPVRDLRIR